MTTLIADPTITVRPATDADLCDAAADYLESHDWIQRHLVDPDGSACMLGALGVVGQVVEIADHPDNGGYYHRLPHEDWDWDRDFDLVHYVATFVDNDTPSRCPCGGPDCSLLQHPTSVNRITQWNDTDGRTKTEVVALLRRAGRGM